MLSSHPDIVTLEEGRPPATAGNDLLASDADLARLATLTPAGAGAARRTYWRGVSQALGEPIADRIFVDKMPLHTASLLLIARLFPDARILFALRDPRDVALSCFRRRFRVNAAMFEFLTLEGVARYYDAVMRLATLCRQRLPLAFAEVRHEAVVADFDGEVGRGLDFIGAPWNASVRDFAAQARGIARTPSTAQVARGLNADGVGQRAPRYRLAQFDAGRAVADALGGEVRL